MLHYIYFSDKTNMTFDWFKMKLLNDVMSYFVKISKNIFRACLFIFIFQNGQSPYISIVHTLVCILW